MEGALRVLFAVAAILSAFLVSSAASAGSERFIINDVEITGRWDPPVGSGVVKAWSKFVARGQDGTLLDFYAVYFGETVPRPEVGQVRDLQGR